MYLKALEIQGFKSFPDKTVLNFGEDITAIVGPNGSGKSNMSDAIRWVMGEQSSKSLRGAQDGGRDLRRHGKARPGGLCAGDAGARQHRAHLPPMEESEVAVTRRYYRSGESEYYINRQSVRLQDVNGAVHGHRHGPGGLFHRRSGQDRRDPCPSRAPTAGRSSRRRRASPSSATARRRRSASWSARRRIWCASTTRSPSWSCRWSRCG